MPYLSNTEYGSSAEDLGCGPECKCGPCKAGLSGLDEWYEKERERQPPPSAQSGQSPPQASSAQPLSGWNGSGFGLAYRSPRRRLPVGPAPAIAPAPGRANSPAIDQRVLQDAIRRGVRNLRQLTAAVFFARHPSRRAEWLQIRDRIARPALQQLSTTSRVSVGGPRLSGFSHFGFGEPQPTPVCEPARSDLTTVADDLKLLNRELGKGAKASRLRLQLKRRLLVLDAEVIIRSLDSYIQSGCCEPALKTLESEVNGLPWPVSAGATKARLAKAIVAAQEKARNDRKHC